MKRLIEFQWIRVIERNIILGDAKHLEDGETIYHWDGYTKWGITTQGRKVIA